MLQASGEETLGFDLLPSAGFVEVADLDDGGAGDVGVLAGEREAAFFPGREFLAGGDDLWVDQGAWGRLVVRGQVDDDQPQALVDLGRGEADAGRGVHAGEHARDKVADGVAVGRSDGACLGLQHGVRRDEDRDERWLRHHWRDSEPGTRPQW